MRVVLALMVFMSNLLVAAPNKGFENNGNSCFMNATMQALFHLEPFRNFLSTAATNNYYPGGSQVSKLIKYFDSLQRAQEALPEKVFRDDFCMPFNMDGFDQHDAQEFLLKLFSVFSNQELGLSEFEKIFNITSSKITFGGHTRKELSRQYQNPETSISLAVERDGQIIGNNLKALLHDFFRTIYPPIIAMDCVNEIGEVKELVAQAPLLSKPNNDKNVIKRRRGLASLLKKKADIELATIRRNFRDDPARPRYNRAEKEIALLLESNVNILLNDLYNLKKSISEPLYNRVEALLELFGKSIEDKIVTFPQVLVVHFKRLIMDYARNRFYKNHDPISFPIAIMGADLKDYALNPASIYELQYRLVAIVEHRGSINVKAYDERDGSYRPRTSGHYVCYALDQANNKWYLYNDSVVTEVSDIEKICRDQERDNKSHTPYLLFYERVNPVSVSLKRLQAQLEGLQHKLTGLSKNLVKLKQKMAAQ